MGNWIEGTLKITVKLILLLWYSVLSEGCQQKCFCNKPDVPRVKQLYHYGSSVPVVLEGSDRVSQNITNHILKTLLEEIIGYSHIVINYQNGPLYNTSDVLRRLDPLRGEAENKIKGGSLPVSMINLEVPVLNGYDTSVWTGTSKIQNAGFLGPKGRLGWYASSNVVDEFWRLGVISDYWRSLYSKSVAEKFALADQHQQLMNLTRTMYNSSKHYCDSPLCEEGVFYGYGCPKTNFSQCSTLVASSMDLDNGALISQVKTLGLPVNIVWIGQNFHAFVRERLTKNHPVLFFDVNPSLLTSTENVTRISFPECQTKSSFYPKNCDFDGNQYQKFIWSKIRYSAPEIYHVISKMTFSDETYVQLLKRYKYFNSTEKAACNWLRYQQHEWNKWIPPNISSKVKVSLLSFFPLTGSRWRQPGLLEGARLALDILNKNPVVLPKHDLELTVVDSQCKPGIALKEYIKYVGKPSSIPIVGVLGPACSDETEPIASLSRHFNMLTISYGAEASSLSNRVNYPYFFRTIPEVSYHKYVYEKFFQAMDWVQIGVIAEGGQEPEYQLMLQEYLTMKGINVIVKHNIQGALQNPDVSEIFADLRSKNVKIIIADFYMPAARAVMCEAYRQRMTSHQGYVWFLPSWYPNDWWDVDFYNSSPDPKESRAQEYVPCSSEMMKYATDGYFQLSKTFSDSDNTLIVGNITVGQYKKMYAKRVGEADVSGSAFASYVYDAVWVYAFALDKLFKNEPGALELINSKSTVQKLVEYVNQTDFKGVSGHIKFKGSNRPGSINILQYFHNGTRLVGQFTPSLLKGGFLSIDQSKILWLTANNAKPHDGHVDVEECVLETIRQVFGVSCEMAIVIANVIGFGVFLILVVLVLVFIKFRYDSKMRKTHDKMKEFGLLPSDLACLSWDESWELPRQQVVVNRKLGEGAFGTVFGGEALLDGRGWVAVAVKALKIGARVDEKIDFLSEADVMKRFHHPNIVQLLGVCTRGEPVYAVMEYHLHGDLKTYLLSRRNLVGSDCKEAADISPERLTQMALDIACGLKYMHDLKYVHRDLACRNCLVHSNLTVKIGDFGMTRPIIESDYYRFTKKGMLPVRWMSPESLWDGLFTSKSDIWSYGVLLYEIVTFGSFPYQGLTNNQVIEYVKNSNRLILPGNCPEDTYRFIYNCLAYDASNRLDLPDIINFLKANPSFLEPCLDAPTNSVYVADDLDPVEFKSTSCHGTMTKSHSTNFLHFFNRLSQNSQDGKRLSGGSQSVKLLTPTKTMVKPFSPLPTQGKPRSNSIGGTAETFQKDDDHYEVPSPVSMNKSHRHSNEFPASFTQCLPLLTSSEKGDRGDETSDYFSDNSKEICQNLTFEMCQTITSV